MKPAPGAYCNANNLVDNRWLVETSGHAPFLQRVDVGRYPIAECRDVAESINLHSARLISAVVQWLGGSL
jgi:hypothetical protein